MFRRLVSPARRPWAAARAIAPQPRIRNPVNAAPLRHALRTVWCLCIMGGCAATSQRPPAAVQPPSHDSQPHDMMAMGTPGGMAHEAHTGHVMGGAPITIPAGARYTEADVSFMQMMIAHHAQAIHMSRLATTREADARLLRLAHKIDLSQAGEIVLMQDWLRANDQFAPDTSSWRTVSMHGMLTAAEIARLEASRGREFDRLYLEYMIRHHEGALTMVSDLYASPRAAQDVDVSVLANDIETTQRAEIGLMRMMLAEL